MTLPTREEALAHFGVKGMRWGVRNSEKSVKELTGLGPSKITRTMANGDTLTLQRNPPNLIHKSLARVSPKYVEAYNNGSLFSIKDKDGKKIGDATLNKRSSEELYLNWIEIKKSSRGQGYASEILKTAAEYGRQQGFKKMTLEVPGIAPDARHIYEKLGFKVTEEAKTTNDIWGGLTTMEYDFDKEVSR